MNSRVHLGNQSRSSTSPGSCLGCTMKGLKPASYGISPTRPQSRRKNFRVSRSRTVAFPLPLASRGNGEGVRRLYLDLGPQPQSRYVYCAPRLVWTGISFRSDVAHHLKGHVPWSYAYGSSFKLADRKPEIVATNERNETPTLLIFDCSGGNKETSLCTLAAKR